VFNSPDPDLLELVFDCSESSSEGQVEGDDMISLRKEQSHIIKEDSDSSSNECCGFEAGKEGWGGMSVRGSIEMRRNSGCEVSCEDLY